MDNNIVAANDLIQELGSQVSGIELKTEDSIVSFANQMKKLDNEEDIRPIVDAIAECKQLVCLNLEGNTLGVNAAKELGKCLESRPLIKKLLFNNLFTGRLKSEIPEVLLFVTSGVMLSNARLDTLDLSDNAIGPVTMPSLLPFLESHSCESLTTLRLNNCGLGIGGGEILAKGLLKLTNLRTLICGRNRLEIKGAQAIGNSLAKLTTLETLEMPQNGIHSEGIEAICRAISSNRNLKNLNLNDNNLRTQSQSIASALRLLTSIETINFGDCLLKTAGCLAICDAIVDNSQAVTIKEINLSGNEIGGQPAIDAIVRCGQTIHDRRTQQLLAKCRLELSSNCFGESGIDQLTAALNQTTILIIDDDEGSADEGEDDEEEEEGEEVDENVEKNKENEADGCVMSTTTTQSDQQSDRYTKVGDENDVSIDELTKKIENDLMVSNKNIDDLCSHFVNISINGFDGQDLKLKNDVLLESELYVKQALRNDNDNEFLAINSLLVNLGLLKDEQSGHYKTVDDLRGPLLALANSVKHMSPQQKHVLRAFMNRPNKSVEQCGRIKHTLMQKLFI
ncbi:ran GTPase-activating protein 1-like [Oppia nitens]|uniref:ran GTPase-activating protein 1-like n=1 Tax=Oppia nitens TaxID=1686743 RepID=UPI0023DAD38B|nr:ran GTPase-activating protein 1-like [Oppia nitens]